jgi:hypothetical protein
MVRLVLALSVPSARVGQGIDVGLVHREDGCSGCLGWDIVCTGLDN